MVMDISFDNEFRFQGDTPAVRYEHSDPSGITVTAMQMDGFSLRLLTLPGNVHAAWLAFDKDAEAALTGLRLDLPTAPSETPWNGHAFTGEDNTELFLDIRGSRNMTVETTPGKHFAVSFDKDRIGPTHLVALIRPASLGPLFKFKDVGADENGGVKFRYNGEGFVFFDMDRSIPSKLVQGTMPERRSDFLVLKYLHGDLDTIWEVSRDTIKPFGTGSIAGL